MPVRPVVPVPTLTNCGSATPGGGPYFAALPDVLPPSVLYHGVLSPVLPAAAVWVVVSVPIAVGSVELSVADVLVPGVGISDVVETSVLVVVPGSGTVVAATGSELEGSDDSEGAAEDVDGAGSTVVGDAELDELSGMTGALVGVGLTGATEGLDGVVGGGAAGVVAGAVLCPVGLDAVATEVDAGGTGAGPFGPTAPGEVDWPPPGGPPPTGGAKVDGLPAFAGPPGTDEAGPGATEPALGPEVGFRAEVEPRTKIPAVLEGVVAGIAPTMGASPGPNVPGGGALPVDLDDAWAATATATFEWTSVQSC